jgi:predicted ATPase
MLVISMPPTVEPLTSAPPAATQATGGAAAWPVAAPPRVRGSLVGRDADCDTLRSLVMGSEGAFVTLVGEGGVGKSRLAIELALHALPRLDGRVAFVPLGGVADPSLVMPAVAGALGVSVRPGPGLSDALRDELSTAPALLVVDGVEHLRAASPALADLWAATPGLAIVATSRVALGVPREQVVRVEPLPVPEDAVADPDLLARCPSVALFLDRAHDARPDLSATPANAAVVAEICRRLDGIPLAIELAAAALRVLPPHQLLDQLDQRLPSLRTAMDWSLGLLPEPARRLYRRVAVLAGPFSARRAELLLEGGERRGVAPVGIAVEAGLAQLVAASLLRHDDQLSAGGRQRYAMLNTVRADALDRLAESGEEVAMRWAHAYLVLAFVEAAERDFPTRDETAALDRLDQALDDVREALEWATRMRAGTFAVRLAGGLAEFWRTRGYLTEGRLRLWVALEIGADAPPADRRKALSGAGLLASHQGDLRLAQGYQREALALARGLGDDAATAQVLGALATDAFSAGDLEAAERYGSESLAIRRRIGDPAGIASALNALGGVHHLRGELAQAREIFGESLALKRSLGNESSIGVSLSNLGLVERDAGNPDAAGEPLREANEIWERTGDRQRLSVGIHNAALLAFDQRRFDEATALLSRAATIARELGDRTVLAYTAADQLRVDVERGDLEAAADSLALALPAAVTLGARVIIPLALEGAGALAAGRGDDVLAIRLWAAAARERATSGFVNQPADERHLDAWMETVRSRLDASALAAAWAEGSTMSVEDSIAAAMTLAPAPGDDPTPAAGDGPAPGRPSDEAARSTGPRDPAPAGPAPDPV